MQEDREHWHLPESRKKKIAHRVSLEDLCHPLFIMEVAQKHQRKIKVHELELHEAPASFGLCLDFDEKETVVVSIQRVTMEGG
jgi:uncharacterized protein Veg